MKIAICSDLHLEFGPLTLENTEGADVIILGGDICVAADLNRAEYLYGSAPRKIMEHSERLDNLLQSCSKNFKHVVMIMGNHEHYHGDFANSASIISEFVAPFENVYFLDKESVTIDDVTFIGGTLWTNYNNRNTSDMQLIEGLMNDYRGVKNSNRRIYRSVPIYKKDDDGNYVYDYTNKDYPKMIQISVKKKEEIAQFSPEDALEDHDKMMAYISTVIEGKFDQRFVVVGHHAPSKASTHPRYAHEKIMNGAYSSNLDDFIVDHPQIKLWTHGHTHEDFDYMIGTTRIVCNPRGYDGYEPRADHFKLKVVEL